MPSIFSSKRTLRVKRVIRGLQPRPSSPSRFAPSSVASNLAQELLPLVGGRLDDLSAAEDEPGTHDVVAEVHGRELGEGGHALGGVLDGTVEDLAVRHVAEPGRHDALAALDPEREVGPLADDPDGAGGVEAHRSVRQCLGVQRLLARRSRRAYGRHRPRHLRRRRRCDETAVECRGARGCCGKAGFGPSRRAALARTVSRSWCSHPGDAARRSAQARRRELPIVRVPQSNLEVSEWPLLS